MLNNETSTTLKRLPPVKPAVDIMDFIFYIEKNCVH